jgi:hypothetical protein
MTGNSAIGSCNSVRILAGRGVACDSSAAINRADETESWECSVNIAQFPRRTRISRLESGRGCCQALLLHWLELQYPVAWREGVQPRHPHLLFGIIRTWPKIGEIRECKGNPLGLQHRVAIGHLQVQVRAGRIAAVAEQSDHISPANTVTRSHLDAPSLQMSVSDETVLCNLQNDVVPGNVV